FHHASYRPPLHQTHAISSADTFCNSCNPSILFSCSFHILCTFFILSAIWFYITIITLRSFPFLSSHRSTVGCL
ncbi:uncharacterized protein V1513DRAFT_400701, partial [Lipomyces chichibuensis]|uniref:uncharacterized protein n=1 Tax=Lipomyces chichibuensis TaxID=1546026 RepID=UPI0033440F98